MKIALFVCFVVLFGYAQEKSLFVTKNKTQFQSDLAKNRAKYRKHKAQREAKKKEAEAKRKIFLNTNSLKVPNNNRVYAPQSGGNEDFLKSFGRQKEDRFFQKILIKNRSHKNPNKYHYTVVRKKSDLKKAGVKVDKNSKVKKVYNYVEIKNTYGRKKNVGVQLEKGSKVKEVVNIVNIKNSKLIDSNVNAGVQIKSKKRPSKVYNDVSLKDSKIGEW